MKKLIIAASILLASITPGLAQKYMTRTGNVTFYSNARLEKIEAHNYEAASVMDSKSGDLVFQVLIKSFKFENETMMEHFNENYMESDKFPKSEYKGKIDNISSVNFAKDGNYPVTSTGKLTLHGITHDVKASGTAEVKGDKVTINSKFNIKLEDYGIKIPDLVAEKISRTIEISVNSEMKAIQK